MKRKLSAALMAAMTLLAAGGLGMPWVVTADVGGPDQLSFPFPCSFTSPSDLAVGAGCSVSVTCADPTSCQGGVTLVVTEPTGESVTLSLVTIPVYQSGTTTFGQWDGVAVGTGSDDGSPVVVSGSVSWCWGTAFQCEALMGDLAWTTS
jgi:hypothetical protein